MVRPHDGRVLQQRLGDLPQPLDALGGGEQGAVAAGGVVDQPLVGLEHRARPAGVAHRELHRQLLQLHARPGLLAVERQRHLRLVGQVEGEVVGAVVADARARREHRPRRLAERDRDDPGALGQPLAGAQVERHAGPAPVVDVALEGDERLGLGLRLHALDVAVADVLAAHHVVRLDRHIDRKTLFFSSEIARGSSAVGGSIAVNASTWNRWVTTMSR